MFSQSFIWRRTGIVICCLALALIGLTGAASAAKGDVDLVSRASGIAGAKGNDQSMSASISADGRFVAFESTASNLDPADGDRTDDVFVRDLQTNTTTLVDRASGATGAKGDNGSHHAAISADGRFVAFDSAASNLIPGDGDAHFDVFVRDLQTNTTTLVSRASGAAGARGNGMSCCAAISGDGRFVAFSSNSSNLDPAAGDGRANVFVRDLQTNTTTLVSRASGPGSAEADAQSNTAAISANGRFVAFQSFADNLDPADPDNNPDIFVRDLQTNTTTLVSRASGASGAKGNSLSAVPSISADGRFVGFESSASNLDPADGDTKDDVFVRDLQTNTTTLVSRATGAGGTKGNDTSKDAAISADGRFVAFDSQASNLDPADSTGGVNVYVRDLQANTTTLVSRAGGVTGATENGFSFNPSISSDGEFVAFSSLATNLTGGDADAIQDIFRRDVLGPPALQASRISIDDVSMPEGDAGHNTFAFTVSLDRAQPAPVSVDFSTADGTATAPSDYVAQSGTLTFAPGETEKAVVVRDNADTIVEPNETFTVNLTDAVGNATIADGQGVGTIVSDDQPVTGQPGRISINDLSLAEGNSSQTAFQFMVSLDQAQSAPVTVRFSTANGTATAPGDYRAGSWTITFAPGQAAEPVTVQVIGDTAVESNETFRVNLTTASGNATIADAQAIGTILNDDQPVVAQPARISIANVRRTEGNRGRTAFRFAVSLDQAQSAPVSVGFSTANGTAKAPRDYSRAAGTVTFGGGETTRRITVFVKGDKLKEAYETFTVNLTRVTGNAIIADARAVGTIVNDDRRRAKRIN